MPEYFDGTKLFSDALRPDGQPVEVRVGAPAFAEMKLSGGYLYDAIRDLLIYEHPFGTVLIGEQ